MDLDEVVREVAKGHGCDVVLNLFAERIRQASEAAVRHSHRKVLPLYIAGVDVGRIWVAGNRVALAGEAHSWTVALLALRVDSTEERTFQTERLGNLTVIYRSDNEFMSDEPPAKSLAESPAENLVHHFIPQDRALWTLDNYEKFRPAVRVLWHVLHQQSPRRAL